MSNEKSETHAFKVTLYNMLLFSGIPSSLIWCGKLLHSHSWWARAGCRSSSPCPEKNIRTIRTATKKRRMYNAFTPSNVGERPPTDFFIVLPALYPSRKRLIWDPWSPSCRFSEPSTCDNNHYNQLHSTLNSHCWRLWCKILSKQIWTDQFEQKSDGKTKH
jgi:hypothetical protein